MSLISVDSVGSLDILSDTSVFSLLETESNFALLLAFEFQAQNQKSLGTWELKDLESGAPDPYSSMSHVLKLYIMIIIIRIDYSYRHERPY